MDLSELSVMLGSILGVLTPLGGVGVFMYRRQNKRLKDAEVKMAEAQAKAEDWHIWKEQCEKLHEGNMMLMERNAKLIQINAEKEDRHAEDLREKEDRFKDQTTRLREVQRELIASQQREIEHVRREAQLERRCDHYKEWMCKRPWSLCKEREPEQQIKHDHYTPLADECDGSCEECKSLIKISEDHEDNQSGE